MLFHLMSPFLQCRQQAVQYEKLPRALHQLLINLQGGHAVCEDGNGKKTKNTIHMMSTVLL